MTAFAIATLTLAIGSGASRAPDDFTNDELKEVFSRPAILRFAGDVDVSTYDYELDGKRAEALLFRPPGDDRKPALLLIPGFRRTAVDMIRTGLFFARAGYVAVAVTQPGFGRSDGPSDWVGPRTIATLRHALSRLAGEAFVDSARIGLYGFSRGALAASLMATTPGVDIKAVIVCSGLYDFKKAYDAYADEGLQGGIKANMKEEAGLSREAFDARTSLDKLRHLNASMLVVHGRKDENVPVEQAEALIEGLKALNKEFEQRIYDDASHGLADTGYLDVCLDFLARKLKGPRTNSRGVTSDAER